MRAQPLSHRPGRGKGRAPMAKTELKTKATAVSVADFMAGLPDE